MRIAYTMTAGRGDLDLLLAEAAAAARAAGLRVAGAVQTNSTRPDCHRCDMDVEVLPDGPVIRISQSLGPGARGCRLDAEGLETAVAEVARRLTAKTDLLIVNKFGKHEAEGRGFRDVIAEALALGVPVLVGANGLNRAAFLAFAGGLAEELPPTADALAGWIRAAPSRKAA
jgi:nucleoside-triphosphatase THEP1